MKWRLDVIKCSIWFLAIDDFFIIAGKYGEKMESNKLFAMGAMIATCIAVVGSAILSRISYFGFIVVEI